MAMQQDWLNSVITQAFQLAPAGITFTESPVPLEQQVKADFVTVLPLTGMLAIEGSDAATFLQGQLSCDLGQVNLTAACRGVHCTPKGRAIASFILCQASAHHYNCLLPCSTLPALRQSLAKYIVFSKAQLLDATHSWAFFGLAGTSARDFIQRYGGGSLPAGPLSRTTFKAGHCIQLEGLSPRYLVALPRSEAGSFWQACSGDLAIADSAAWELLDIRQGIGNIVAGTSEVFIPQMLNLDKLRAISFRKGCYTGQEVVARAHYRGAVKRRMRYFTAVADTVPNAGSALAGESVSGTFVNALATGGGRIEGLVVLGEDQPAQAKLELDGKRVSISTSKIDYPDA
jgi:folate-binding protein YgfZ